MSTQPYVVEDGLIANAILGKGKCCPNCGFALPKPAPKLSADDKKHAQDMLRAHASIRILSKDYSTESASFQESVLMERERLLNALDDAYKLKRIFRRKET
jgi:hypothetical protein